MPAQFWRFVSIHPPPPLDALGTTLQPARVRRTTHRLRKDVQPANRCTDHESTYSQRIDVQPANRCTASESMCKLRNDAPPAFPLNNLLSASLAPPLLMLPVSLLLLHLSLCCCSTCLHAAVCLSARLRLCCFLARLCCSTRSSTTASRVPLQLLHAFLFNCCARFSTAVSCISLLQFRAFLYCLPESQLHVCVHCSAPTSPLLSTRVSTAKHP
ncbi:hypothetical protein PLICRDRAFT_281171 [Plicaturopsis crispa FD-325 SS-3]|nr:hypothetical protein PLICRDRAFT_281171 [Plicaturopsis crispa FD-325 SS-3]